MDQTLRRVGRLHPAFAVLIVACFHCGVNLKARAQEPGSGAEGAAPVAFARFEGVASPGLRITLKGDRSTGPGLHYRWVQTRGAVAVLDQPEAGETSMVVPEGDEPLGFMLVVGNARGVSSSPLTIPVEPVGAGHHDPSIRADAGDDLVGLVGRQVTLNGIRSESRGRIGYRWIQAGGPPVALKLESGCYYTFVPPTVGTYQFALVVASGDRISEPDYVSVVVNEVPAVAASGPVPRQVSLPSPSLSTEELTRLAARSMEEGARLAPELSRIFADIAGRMDLFQSYEEAFSEMSRRLDTVIPRGPDRRDAWTRALFIPLSLRMVETLRLEGLDLSRPEGQSSPLTTDQRKRLTDHFRSMASGFGRVSEEKTATRSVDRPLDR